jgi:hypothetical protein
MPARASGSAPAAVIPESAGRRLILGRS